MSNIASGISYYVDPTFEQKYTHHWRDLSRIERMVQQSYASTLAETCDNLRMRQRRMLYDARRMPVGEFRTTKMNEAMNMKLPACEKLQRLRPYLY